MLTFLSIAVNNTNKIPLTSIVLRHTQISQISEMDILKLGKIKPNLSTWLDTIKASAEILYIFSLIWVNSPFNGGGDLISYIDHKQRSYKGLNVVWLIHSFVIQIFNIT